LDLIRTARLRGDATIAPRMLGLLQTSWVPAGDFIRAYYGEISAPPPTAEAKESSSTFKALFNVLRALE